MSCPFGGGLPANNNSNSNSNATEATEKKGASNQIVPDPNKGVYYNEYLQLDKILSAQTLESEKQGAKAHDEMLFIIVHQAYELWFKQILHEIESCIGILNKDYVEEYLLGTVVSRIKRVTEIQKLLISQIAIIETMLPQDFLDFRKFLLPASGFQSVQFRLLENRLGLPVACRSSYQNTEYLNYFKKHHQILLSASTATDCPTLLSTVNRWLERTPFLQVEGFHFWEEYRKKVHEMLEEDRQTTISNPMLNEEGRAAQLQSQKKTEKSFDLLFDESAYTAQYKKGNVRLSYRAMQAALLIYLYRDKPMLQIPFNLLTHLTEIDEHLTTWRYRHTVMVQRMIGVKLGTGGSSGYYYLKSTVSDKYKVFGDLFNLSTYLIPRSKLPTLPPDLERKLNFAFDHLRTVAKE